MIAAQSSAVPIDPRSLHYLVDRQRIEDIYAREAHGFDRHDPAILDACFVPGLQPALRLPALADGTRAHSHGLTTQATDISGDEAQVTAYVLAIFYLSCAERVRVESLRYDDRLIRHDDGWRIAERRASTDLIFEAPAQPLDQAAGGYATGSRDRADPSYRRPLIVPDALAAALADAGPARARPAIVAQTYSVPPSEPAARLGFVADRWAIRDTIGSVARSFDAGDGGAAPAKFMPGAIIAEDDFRGDADAYTAANTAFQRRHLTSHNAEIGGSDARAESYVILFEQDGGRIRAAGQRLLDRLDRSDGLWRIRDRQTVTEWEFHVEAEEPGR